MRLAKLRLLNLGPYTDAEINLDHAVTLIGGDNGTGKTTIRRALELALTGGCDLSESGRGLDGLRRDGSRRKWSIGISAKGEVGPWSIARTEGEGPNAQVQQLLDKHLGGIAPHHVRACLRATELIYGSDKAAQRIVLELCDPGVQIPGDLALLAADYKIQLDPVMSLAALDAAYKVAYAARREKGRFVEELRAATPELPNEIPATAAGLTLEQLDQQAQKLTGRVADLRAERDKALAAAERKASAPAKLAAQLEAARDKLAEMPFEEGDDDPSSVEERIEKLAADRSALASDRLLAERRVEKERGAHSAAMRELERAQAQLKQVDELGDHCPLCTQAFVGSVREKLVGQLRTAERKAEAMVKKAVIAVEVAQEALTKVPDPDAILKQITAARAGLQAAEARQKTVRDLAATIADLEAKLAEASANAEADAAELREKARLLDEKIELGEQRAQALARYAGARHAAERIEGQRGFAERTYADLDRLCNELGPDGLRTTADGSGLDDLQAAINAVTHPMGFSVELGPVARLEGPLVVNGRPARLLSSSEQVRVGLGIQAAIAQFSGLGLIVLDDLDRCLGPARAAIQSALREIGAGCQVVILTAVRDVAEFSAKAPAMEKGTGWRVWLAKPTADGTALLHVGVAEVEAA